MYFNNGVKRTEPKIIEMSSILFSLMFQLFKCGVENVYEIN